MSTRHLNSPSPLDRPFLDTRNPNRFNDEESMVADGRAGLSPSQCVDLKLAEILHLPAEMKQPRERMIPGIR
jgi:hypothetical protein